MGLLQPPHRTIAVLALLVLIQSPALAADIAGGAPKADVGGSASSVIAGGLPLGVQQQIDAMLISRESPAELARRISLAAAGARRMADPAEKNAAKAQSRELRAQILREVRARHLLRAVYGQDQLKEQMTWFWANHFSVYALKRDIPLYLADYEDAALRPHALGRFRDILGAATRHPAMLRYLDNDRNVRGALNENHARELMELHTLGVNGGYTQADVQELARILTGFGVDPTGRKAAALARRRDGSLTGGAFVFDPARHDAGDKQLLGQRIAGQGADELDEALDILARHPATARHVSLKLATYFLADEPPGKLVDRISHTFQATDGDMAAVLDVLFTSNEFQAGHTQTFKDPMRYAVSTAQLVYPDAQIRNPYAISAWLRRLGQPLYGRETPDGYPLKGSAWADGNQLAARFELAATIGRGAGEFVGLGRDEREKLPPPSPPDLRRRVEKLNLRLGPETKSVLSTASSQAEWNTLLLSAPEFMWR